MGPEHDSDPLVSPRGDEPEGEPAAGAEAPIDEPLHSPSPSSEPVPEPDPESEREPEREPVASSGDAEPRPAERRPRSASPNMLPTRKGRGILERSFVRVVATGGIVGICVAIAAIMSSSNSQGWVIGLVVSLVSVVLAAVLWSSRIL